jgi:hypothetical protein
VPLEEGSAGIARRLNFLLDGLAVHILSGKVSPEDAEEVAMAAIRAEITAAQQTRERSAGG